MIGLDTNVIVRYLTKDDPVQSPMAVNLIRSLSAEEPGFISLVVIAELAWVLERSYGFDKPTFIGVFQGLLQSKELLLEDADVVAQALNLFSPGRANFADYVIERSGHSAGCMHTFTFDQQAASSAGMRLLQ